MSDPSPVSGRFVPHLQLLALIAIWGASFTAIKVALRDLAPFALIVARFWLAIVCLLPWALRATPAAAWRAARGPGILTGTALGIGYLLQATGMRETSASTGGILAGTIVLLVAVGGWLFFGAPLRGRTLVGLLCGLVGMVLVCWPQSDAAAAAGAAHDTLRGIGLQLGSMVAFAGHVLLISHLGRTAPALPYALWQLLTTAVMATVAMAVTGQMASDEVLAAGRAIEWSVPLLGSVAYLGLLATALGIVAQSRVQPKIPPPHVALLFATQPLFAALVGWACLGDRLGPLQGVGGAAIIAGVLLAAR